MTALPPRAGPRRRGLGRGLEALLGPVGDATVAADPGPGAPAEGAMLVEVDPALVDTNPEQPRRDFDDRSIAALAESIRNHGLLHPIVVERAGSRYQLVAGERRLRAVRLAELPTVLAIVRPAGESGRDWLESALTENLLRTDLSPIDEAAAYARLADTFGLSHEAIALRLGRSRPTVTNTIRLLALPAGLQKAIADGAITAGHARALLAIPNPIDQEKMAARASVEDWSVRQTEDAVRAGFRRARRAHARASASPSADDEALRRGLEAAIGLPVELQRQRRKGRVVITFHDDQDLHALYQRLGGSPL